VVFGLLWGEPYRQGKVGCVEVRTERPCNPENRKKVRWEFADESNGSSRWGEDGHSSGGGRVWAETGRGKGNEPEDEDGKNIIRLPGAG